MDDNDVLDELKTMLERQAGRHIAHQMILARILLADCKDAAKTNQIEEALLSDLEASEFGATDDRTKLEIRRFAREEMLEVMTIIRDARGHRRTL